jgi:hypothetical protein
MARIKHCYFCKYRARGGDRQDLTKAPCKDCKNWSKFRRDPERNY